MRAQLAHYIFVFLSELTQRLDAVRSGGITSGREGQRRVAALSTVEHSLLDVRQQIKLRGVAFLR